MHACESGRFYPLHLDGQSALGVWLGAVSSSLCHQIFLVAERFGCVQCIVLLSIIDFRSRLLELGSAPRSTLVPA